MSEQNGTETVAEEVYAPVLTAISEKEALAYRRMGQWRSMAILIGSVCAGLLVVIAMLVSQAKTRYVMVGVTEEGHVRLTRLPEQGWTLTQNQIRAELRRWLMDARPFGTDEIAIAQARLRAWNMSLKPAQAWLGTQFNALPTKQVNKVIIRFVQSEAGVPDIRIVPPMAGRTWEVFWQEEWRTTQSMQPQKKAFLALITITVKEPQTDGDADHQGVWIEHISVDERIPAQHTAAADR